MAAEAFRLLGFKFKLGRSGGSASGEWLVVRAEDEDAAYQAVIDDSPPTIQSIPRDSFDFTEKGDGAYHVAIDYSPAALTDAPESGAGTAGENPGPKGAGEGGGNPAGDADPDAALGRSITLSTGSGTKHITTSLEQIAALRSEDRPGVDCRAIGWTRTGIEGTDVIAPTPEITASIKMDLITLGYFLRVCALVGTVNDAPWNGFAAGEILFVSAEFVWEDGKNTENGEPGHWNSTFRFKYEANEENGIDIGDMHLDRKDGWDLIDVIYSETDVEADPDDPTDIVLIQVPEYVYVHRVYKRSDFADLCIDEIATLIPF